jgi:CRISPR-associated protein Cas5d
MGYGIQLDVWGDYALFTRPEFKTERVSYDVITPSAARGILESIFFKPGLRWKIDAIYVYNEVQFTNIRRNEVSSKILFSSVKQAMNGGDKPLYLNTANDRQLRGSMILKDVHYCISAHFEMTEKAGEYDSEEKFYAIATRRMRNGECFSQPYFGCREFPVCFRLVEDDFVPPSLCGEKDLGYMLYDMDYSDTEHIKPMFFRAKMVNGIIDLTNVNKMG